VEPSDLFRRRKTVPVACGNVVIGGEAPVSIQTMTKTLTRDVEATIREIEKCVATGADVVRVAVPDEESARALSKIKKAVSCPIVADIHFDYKLALLAIETGADKVRINPGNIGGREGLTQVAKKAKERGIPLRLGVNSGSVEKDILARYGGPTPEAMVESAQSHLSYLEDQGVPGIVVSLKSSSVKDTIAAYMLMARRTSWPFHIGVTEAGPGTRGIIKSTLGIGVLLAMGIGDTIRVSLTGSSTEEVSAGKEILQGAGLRSYGPDIISCPTCGRTQVDIIPIVKEVAEKVKTLKTPIKIAIMGCPVNGPGEAKEADLGVACGREGGILFLHGKVLGKVGPHEISDAVVALARKEEEGLRRE